MLVLSVCDCNIDKVVALVGNHENTNCTFARCIEPTFAGCHSHRFILAFKDILKEHADITVIVHGLMHRLSYQIPSAKLRMLTLLLPKMHNDKRWSSMFNMLRPYTQLRFVIP